MKPHVNIGRRTSPLLLAALFSSVSLFPGCSRRSPFEEERVSRASRFRMHRNNDCVLISEFVDEGMSIPDNIEHVVYRVIELHGARRILYRDSVSGWCEVKYSGCRFTEFARLTPDEVEWCEAHAL